MTTLAVLAKAPTPGRVKTRLCPPCTPGDAARLADAALRDTLETARATVASRVVLVLDGGPLRGCEPAIEVISQRGDGLGERLAAAFSDIGGPVLLIGMDTPQVTPAVLDAALLQVDGGLPVLGTAPDGGWWALGLPVCPPDAFVGVPMSTATTGQRQRARLEDCGLTPVPLPELRDVDHWSDALLVAAAAPASRFARAVEAVDARLPRVAP